MATLRTYRAKRDFGKTPEPRGTKGRNKGFRYVIQKHAATRLHYDLRLELDGVMKSWAVTRGPSLVPGDKRLAVHVEDHPIEYNKFEGIIPKGEYGGGTVMVWDRGRWFPEYDPHKGMAKGHLEFRLEGEKLKGRWHLVRMNKRPGERQEPWLLIKSDDEFARKPSDTDVLEELDRSAVTGRTMDEIAANKKRKVWHSNKPARPAKPATAAIAPARAITGGRSAKAPNKPRNRAAHRQKKTAKLGDTDLGGIPGAREARIPEFVEPCLATLASAAPASGDWVHEIKFDGYRIQARIVGEAVALRTRKGLDWTSRFPGVARAFRALAGHDAIVDGEIVSIDARGVSDFSALQDDLKSGRGDRLIYYAFDLLHLDGYDLTGATLTDRKRVLTQWLAGLPENGVIRVSETFDVDGPVLIDHARKLHLEGIVSKRRRAPYRSGRGGDWLKIKTSNSQEFVIAGYEPSDKSSRRIRSLLLAYQEEDELRYAGRVGTGWGEATEQDLERRLAPLARDRSPFDPIPEEERRRHVQWVEPRVVVEVDFRGWTGGNLVRQAAFKGVREDKPAKEVVREVKQMPGAIRTRQAALRHSPQTKIGVAKTARADPAAVAGVRLTHPDRVYWPDAGVTKAMLAEYYAKVWDWMQPQVTGRVLALLRGPEGIGGQLFFQKHASAGINTKHLHLVPELGGDTSISIDRLDGLIALVQAGVLEIHVRGSTIDHLEEANRLVFDLDPGPGVEWPDVIAAAREVRQRLRDVKLESFVKTTGGKGLHVVAPIRFAPWDEAKDFCRSVAEQMAADSRDRFTATIKKSARGHRIFVDYLRNSREATAVAPYSTRARPGATVATPLSWDELGSQKAPNVFTTANLPNRLARLRTDPWAEMSKLKQRLPAAANREPGAKRGRISRRSS